MKNIFTLFLLTYCLSLHAQPRFLGVSEYQGGSIFNYDGASQSVVTVYKHKVNEIFPSGTLSTGPDGRLYGTTLNGGVEGNGAIYSYDPQGGQYTLLYTFLASDGVQPTGELCWGANGMVYGLTNYGGTANNGVLFSFNTVNRTYTVLHHFDGLQGANPTGGLYLHTDGLLYGTTQTGGTSNEGVLFSFDPRSNQFQKLADFQMATGAHPSTGLVKGKDGKLYGATTAGGPEEAHAGNIFRFDPVKKTLSVLYYFRWDNSNGFAPVGRLLLQPDGRLYGVTQNGGINGTGAIFRFNPANRAFTLLHSLDATTGGQPAGGLVADAAGKLYGFTRRGNTHDYGGIFSYDPLARTVTSLHAFAYTDGIDVSGSVCLTADRRLYGVAPFGGTTEYGTLFSYNTATATFAKVKEFDEAPDGAYPVAAPVLHTDGVYYGTTNGGGNYGKGVVYAFHPATGQYEVAYRFSEAHGQYMGSGFVAGNNGQLYGLLSSGGAEGAGQLFAFDPVNRSVQVLHNFSIAGAAYPNGGLVKGEDGFYYGVTSAGGSSGLGTIFRFDAATQACTPVASFMGNNGAVPIDGLTPGLDGRLYGVTQMGGASGIGVIYAFNPATAAITLLHNFDFNTGENPTHGLALAPNGSFYGATAMGGIQNNGVLYRYDPLANTYSLLHHFDANTGAHPEGRLSLGSDGQLYGTTRYGGTNDMGVVFRVQPASGVAALVAAFDGSGSGNSGGGGLTAWCTEPATFYRDRDGDGIGTEANMIKACVAPAGYVASRGDCNDASAAAHPGAAEICGNGVDDDCDGTIDEGCRKQPKLQVQSMEVSEGAKFAKVSFTLDQPAPKKTQVHFQTEPLTAQADKDFGMRKGVIRFAAGSTSAVVFIPVYADEEEEADELFRVVVSKSKEISLGDEKAKAAEVVIKDQKGKGNVLFAAKSKTPPALDMAGGMTLHVFPNPAVNQFAVVVASGSKAPVQVLVTDAVGKIVERRSGQVAGQPMTFGAAYGPGVYMIQVVQGDSRSVQKLIKR